ncbi:unnamed protein product [Rotaria sp. Silwood2]|nr:unnamed protein product [Rotaria sp. Silwood2]CAF4521577.1 unnamed protein product [Rotaria sp. Silwood2]
MPKNGSCTDVTCNNEIKELYECHCCLRLVCLCHLNKHVEIEKKSKQRSDSLRNELNTIVNTLKEILEEKQLTIEREQHLIEQAKQFLGEPNISIDELQSILEKIHQTIILNRSEITVKVEPSLSETEYCSHVCKYNKENINPNDVTEESRILKDRVLYLEDISHDFIDLVSNDETTKSIQHKLNRVYIQRLQQAIAANKDPRKTKLFHRNENVIDCFNNVPCPFFSEQMNSSNYTRQNEAIMLCQLRLVPIPVFKRHLQLSHNISDSLAQKLYDDFRGSRKK